MNAARWLGALALLGLLAAPAGAQTPAPPKETERQVLFSADEVDYDKESGVVIAKGKVEVTHAGRVLLADEIAYDSKRDRLFANGNVSLLELSGDVYFAEQIELSGDLKEGAARNIRILLANQSRLAAAEGRRVAGERHDMDRAVYSACEVCKENPDRPLIWQVKAVRVVHDESTETVEYHHAWLEVFGLPILYTPYIAHADPRVPRRSGFLPPTFGGSKQLGGAITVPYYVNISPSEDVTVSAMITGREGPVAIGQHRRHFQDGKIESQASFTRNSDEEYRGHIKSKGLFDLNETWRAGYDLARSTDDTYMRTYGFRHPLPVLETRPFLEGFGGRSYALAQAFSYQGLRAKDDPGMEPFVLPMLEYHRVGQPGPFGQYWSFDAGGLAITRGDGTDTRRLSSRIAWQLPYTAPAGDVYKLTAQLRGEGYHTDNWHADGRTHEGFTGRMVPELSLDWRFPLVRHGAWMSDVIEPVVVGTVAPNGMNPTRMPNEDSLDFEFDETNLFRPGRFAGLDRYEGGSRVAYGLKWSAFGNRPGSISAMLGQSYRVHTDSTFARDTGLADHLSDYVGRVDVNPRGNLRFLYRFRIDKDDLSAARNEIGAQVGPKAFQLSANYLFVDQSSLTGYPEREQLSASLSSALTQNWSGSLSTLYDLGANKGPLMHMARLIYDDECFALGLTYMHRYTHDREYKGGEAVMLRFVFKTLGEYQTRFDQQ